MKPATAVKVLAGIAGLAAATAAVIAVSGQEGLSAEALLEAVLRWIRSAPVWSVAAAFLLGPLVGLPASPFVVALGLALPILPALALTAVVMAVHHVLLYGISHTPASRWLRERLAGLRLLPGHRAGATFGDNAFFLATVAWVPGPAYVLKVAYATLAGVPFRTLVFLGTLAQLVGAVPFLILGEAAAEGKILWMLGMLFALAALAWLAKRLLARSQAMPAAESPSGDE